MINLYFCCRSPSISFVCSTWSISFIHCSSMKERGKNKLAFESMYSPPVVRVRHTRHSIYSASPKINKLIHRLPNIILRHTAGLYRMKWRGNWNRIKAISISRHLMVWKISATLYSFFQKSIFTYVTDLFFRLFCWSVRKRRGGVVGVRADTSIRQLSSPLHTLNGPFSWWSERYWTNIGTFFSSMPIRNVL